MKTAVKNILLIILFLIPFSPVFSDETADRTDLKKEPAGFLFFWKEKFSYSGTVNFPEILNLKNQINFSYSRKFNFYQIKLWADDLLVSNFFAVYEDQAVGITDASIIVKDVIFHAFSTGIDQRLRVPKVLDIFINFGISLNTPFNDYPYLSFTPGIRFTGSYYTGIDWELDALSGLDIFPAESLTVWYPQIFASLSYEFFRFYGPDNFRFTLFTENTFSPELNTADQNNYLTNLMKSGIYFNFYGLSPSAAFVYQTEWSVQPFQMYSQRFGFSTGLTYQYRILNLSVEYTGSYDTVYREWINRVDLSIRLGWYR